MHVCVGAAVGDRRRERERMCGREGEGERVRTRVGERAGERGERDWQADSGGDRESRE